MSWDDFDDIVGHTITDWLIDDAKENLRITTDKAKWRYKVDGD